MILNDPFKRREVPWAGWLLLARRGKGGGGGEKKGKEKEKKIERSHGKREKSERVRRKGMIKKYLKGL